jgi:predicted dehydrogenase
VYESRLLTKLAKKYRVATQLGNQGNSFDWCRQVAEWIESGVIGDVYEVHCWTDRPIWPQGLPEPKGGVSVPETLDWDLWIGPAKKRAYDPAYTPWNWRGFWDFGTGALGDMACHIMDPLYWALDLKYPSSVSASSTLSNLYSPPQAQIVRYTFPARAARGKVKMPEVKVYWYDGGLLPDRPEELKDGEMMGDENGGIIFTGTKGKIMTGCYGMSPTLLPKSEMAHFEQPKARIPRIKGGNGDIWSTNAHEQDWIRACKEPAENRVESSSNFQFSGPFNEMVVMGVLATRLSGLQGLHRELQWDGEKMEFTNIAASDKIRIVTLDNYAVVDGDPHFDRRFADFSAQDMAREWINHTCNNGFKLPEMPA